MKILNIESATQFIKIVPDKEDGFLTNYFETLTDGDKLKMNLFGKKINNN